MRRGGSKQKGAQNERNVCRQLSLWVTHGKQEDVFWRSAMSGGRATVAKRKGISLASQAGDISSVDKSGHILTNDFYIETKHVKDIGLTNFIVDHSGPLMKYWTTAINEAQRYRKLPLLLVKQNRKPILLICDVGTVTNLTGGKLRVQSCLAKVYSKPKCEIWLFDTVLATPFAYES